MDASDVLRLEVRNFQGPAQWDWALTTAAGEFLGDHEVRLDPQSPEYKAMTRLQFYVRWHADPERPLESENEFLGRVGQWMGEQILGDVGRKLVEQRPAIALVVVPQDAEVLRHWPFELAWVGGQPLARQEVSLVFSVPAENPVRRKEPIGKRLRMLAVFSLPSQEPLLVLGQQRYELVRSIERIATSKAKSVALVTLQYGVTRERLRGVLEEGEGWDVIHFSGHGLATHLLLEGTGGEADPVPTNQLLDMLHLARNRLKLLVLSSCDSGAAAANEAMQARASQIPSAKDEADDSPTLPSLAVEAARQLDCAVLGMRYRVGDDFSIDLARHLYDRLFGKGTLLPRALQLALPDALKHWPEPGNPPLSVATPALFGDRAVDLSLVPPEAEPHFAPRLKMSYFRPEPKGFVGRVEPMAAASRALTSDNQVSGVLFYGQKLTGKTACAIELAYRYEDQFTRLAWYPPLTGGEPIALTVTGLAEALETQLEGFGSEMKDAADNRSELERFLPRLTKLMEQYAILVAIDGLEALLTSDGNWRDDKWRLVVNALLDHDRGSRLVLTSQRVPTALHHRLSLVPVPALSPIEALLLARQLPNLGDVLRGRTELPMEQAAPLLADTLAAANGLPALIREADQKLASSVLDELPAHIAALARAAGPSGGTTATREEYLPLVRKWTRGIHRSSSAVAPPVAPLTSAPPSDAPPAQPPPVRRPPGPDLNALTDKQIGLLCTSIMALKELLDICAELDRTPPLPADLADVSPRWQGSLNQAGEQLGALKRQVTVGAWPDVDWVLKFGSARNQVQEDIATIQEHPDRAAASGRGNMDEREKRLLASVTKLLRMLQDHYPSLFTHSQSAGTSKAPARLPHDIPEKAPVGAETDRPKSRQVLAATAFSGEIKLKFCQRIGQDWQDLADLFGVPPYAKAHFAPGDEPRALWEWLEIRDRLAALPDKLTEIGRDDLAQLMRPPEP